MFPVLASEGAAGGRWRTMGIRRSRTTLSRILFPNDVDRVHFAEFVPNQHLWHKAAFTAAAGVRADEMRMIAPRLSESMFEVAQSFPGKS